MATQSKTLNDLFRAALRDAYDAEKQILRALPKLADAADSAGLREAFLKHRQETAGQIKRIEQVFAAAGEVPRARRSAAIRSILAEGDEAIRSFGGDEAGDVALAASAQAVEHYEIARYGALKGWAEQLGLAEAAGLLDETLQEEISTDRTLADLRRRRVVELTGEYPEAESFQQTRTSRSLRAGGVPDKDHQMPRQSSNIRERDEQGRFVSDDDDDRRRSYSRSRSDDDDYRSSRSGRSSSRSRDDDYGSSRSGGRSQGGWFGDSEGHSEAARRGWESRDEDYRSSSRGRSRDDDERSYRSRSRDDDDYRGSSRSRSRDEDSRGRRHGGWFGDSEGHSEAARRGWDNPNHGESGWFGDSEGHSEASRRGWRNPDHRESGWFGDSEGHSEAARRGWDNPNHGESGWFGDPEGHSEASRRGWEERGSSRSRSRYDDDDDRRTSSRGRDEEGRFTSRSSRDDDYRSSRSRSR